MRSFWTEEEDLNLKRAVEKCQTKDQIKWKSISKLVGTRTARQCMQRWIDVLRPGIKKGTWSKYEDIILQRVVTLHGFQNWTEIARLIPKRTAKQCRERWHQNLAPHLSKQPFSSEDDQLLLKLFENYGSKWTVIAKHFKNRSANLIKCRWKSLHRQYIKSRFKKIKKIKESPQDNLLYSKYPKTLWNLENSCRSTQETNISKTLFTPNIIDTAKATINFSPAIQKIPTDKQAHNAQFISMVRMAPSHQNIAIINPLCNCETCHFEAFINKDEENIMQEPRLIEKKNCFSAIRYLNGSNLHYVQNEDYQSIPSNEENRLCQNIYQNNFYGHQKQNPLDVTMNSYDNFSYEGLHSHCNDIKCYCCHLPASHKSIKK